MIFLYLALLFGFAWWLTDKYLGENFLPYLKYAALIFIGILIAVDAYMFIETERFYNAKIAGGERGIKYSHWNGTGTQEIYVYDLQGIDSSNIVAYHEIEHQTMRVFTGVLPTLGLFIGGAMIFQVLYILYMGAYHGMTTKKKTDNPVHMDDLKTVDRGA